MYYNNSLYRDDLESALESTINLEKMRGTSILVTGASGLIGSFLVDKLMLCNELLSYDMKVYALGRNAVSLAERFKTHNFNPSFHILQHDINKPLSIDYHFDFIIHAASNAYPQAFAVDPVGTITTNVFGVYNILEHMLRKGGGRLLYVSSGEVYGQGSGVSSFDESYGGYIDSTNPRSCYPNAKRLAETLCVAFSAQHGIDTVIVRPSHTYGPTATARDNRVSSQFINNVMAGHDIIMKSDGSQLRSYCYVADCVSGIMTVLLNGKSANAYNIANKRSDVTIREMAETIADISRKKVVFQLPDKVEKAGYNPVTQSVLSAKKLEYLGWNAKYDLKQGLTRTISILGQLRGVGSEDVIAEATKKNV